MASPSTDSDLLPPPALPLAVALEVVLQGLRVRLGRSLVTLMGVALGVAFLMSVLTRQVISRGVEAEERDRAEVRRVMSLLSAECGSLRGQTVGVLQLGPLNAAEQRLLAGCRDEAPAAVRWAGMDKSPPADATRIPGLPTIVVSPNEVGREVSLLLVLGGTLPADAAQYVASARHRLLASLRGGAAVEGAIDLTRREADDPAAVALAERREKARTLWVVIIALLVTVIGISNAMLMSVTERFREIGTMKCLGAVSGFIRRIFLIESVLIGSVGSAMGVLLGIATPLVVSSFRYGPRLVLAGLSWQSLLASAAITMAAGVVLSVIAALYPARVASRMVPAMALRSNV